MRKTFRSRTTFALSLCALFLIGARVSFAAKDYDIQWKKQYDLNLANDPLAVDLGLDGKPEIVLTDSVGTILVIDAATGKEIWKTKIGGTQFSSALAGNFLGSGAQEILACGSDKVVRLFNAADGELAAELNCGVAFAQPPTLLPSDTPGDRDRFILIDDVGTVCCFRFESAKKIDLVWQFKTQVQPHGPAAVGNMRGPGKYDVALADYDGHIYSLEGETGKIIAQGNLPANRTIDSGVALGQLTGKAGEDEIYVGDEKGYLHAFKQDPQTPSRLAPIWPEPASILGNPLGTLAAIDLNKDEVADSISIYHGDVIVVDGVTAQTSRWSASYSITAPPTIVNAANGRFYGFVIDDQGTFYAFNLSDGPFVKIAEVRENGDVGNTMVATAIGPEKQVAIFAIRKLDGTGISFKTPLKGTADSVLWQTFGGSMLHSGGQGAGAAERQLALSAGRKNTLQTMMQEMKAFAAAGEWRKARDKAEGILNYDSENADAQAVLGKANFRLHLHWYILTIILLGAAGWIFGRPLYRIYWRKSQLKLGNAAVKAGDFDKASQGYHRLLERYPQDKDVNAQLAILFMKQGDFSERTIPVYERMHQHDPENLPIIQALARAYLNAGRQDDTALDIYVKASDQFDEPGRLNHALGGIYHSRGDDKSALAFLRKAMREDYRPHELILLLADVYLNLNVRASAGISIYETAYAARPQDTRLLLALAECYAARQQTDAQAEEVYERLLEMRPEHEEVRLMLSQIKLHQGAYDEAIRHAQAVLDLDPDSTEAVAALTQACLAAARSDDEAIGIYRRAAQLFHDDAALLKSIALIFIERDLQDDEARNLVRDAYHRNPDDMALARAVYQMAVDSGEQDLLVQAAESIVKAGEATPEIWSALAAAFCERNSRGDHVEMALRQAMTLGNCDARVAVMLGDVYAEAGRTDANALWVYEALAQRGELSLAVGERFIQALLEDGRVEDAATHARALLEKYPQDETIRRLLARANMESNRIDEAVKQYETLLHHHPDDPEAVVQLATAYARKNRMDDSAMMLYAHAEQVAPENPLFPIMKVRALAEDGNIRATAEALKDTAAKGSEAARMVAEEVQKLLNLHPGALPLRWLAYQLAIESDRNSDALEQIVAIQERDSKQTEQVADALDKLLLKDPHNAVAHLHRGRMLRQLGNSAESRQSLELAFSLMAGDQRVQSELAAVYEQILKENSASSEADEIRFRLGKLSMALKSYDKAIQCFQATAQDFRYETESIKRLAQCFMGKGMLDLALQEFKKLHIDSDVKDLLYELAQRYEQKHDLVGAKNVYRMLFAADITYRNVREKFESLAGSTSDPLVFEKTSILNSLSDEAKRRYELIEEIGRGAMGIVYKAHDNELQEIVALKILPDNLSNNPEALRRFKAEARSARRLSHPNIVRIHDIGEEMGRKYISMEFVEGSDLKKRLRAQGPFSFEQLAGYARQICGAMAYAHGEGIVHRDIKPANIMVTNEEKVKVTDFGIAKVCESPDATLAGAIIGTPLYMSPEQVQGAVCDNRTDIYSLGILFYELASGRPPFTEGDLAYQHIHVAPKPLTDVPAELWAMIERCLKKDREERWPTVDAMLTALAKAD